MFAVAFIGQVYAESGSEAAVKTAFLYNFFKFIDWPETVANNADLQLCVVGSSGLGESLAVLENKTIANKPLIIKRGPSGQELKRCHIVFIAAGENSVDIVRGLKGLPVVTVSDKAAFIDQGGMIGFVEVENRLGFEINNDVANSNGVHINAQLLKLAQRVKAGN